MNISLLAAGPPERAWLHNLLAKTPYRKENITLAAPVLPGQPTSLDSDLDLLLLSENAVPPHLLNRLLLDLPEHAALLLISADPAGYRPLLAQSGRSGWGILSPSTSPAQLEAAIGAVRQGLCVLPPVPDEAILPEALTPRELEVTGLLAQGLSNKQIAHRLHLSENTVKTHIAAVYGKAGINNRAELVMLAVRLGWVAL
ncbi:MAG: response regulator transcription factor [Anaerolineaceae bacterium]|nr:response regulator transcription factor [Anaerolineaceae bacterium]